jgi:hypothetical protein
VVTNPKIYPDHPATIDEALAFADRIRNQPHAHVASPGPRFWEIFSRLCRQVDTRAKLVPMPIWPHWPSSTAASSYPRTRTSGASRGCAGGIP